MTKKNKVIRRDRMPAVDTPMSDTLTVILALDVWNACCLLYTSDAADERSSVDLGGRRIIKKKKKTHKTKNIKKQQHNITTRLSTHHE